MDGEIGSLILHAHGAQCTAPHKHEEYVSSGAENNGKQPWRLWRLLGMLQTLIRQFLPVILETDRNMDCMPPSAACSAFKQAGAAKAGG